MALGLQTCIPFQLTDDPDGGAVQFLQFYAWLHSVVDVHVNAVLTALEESGQADNTIVIFLADHGEYAAAHGMMIEKWHTAYQEALHVPVVVQYPPVVRNAMKAYLSSQNYGAPADPDTVRRKVAAHEHAQGHHDVLRQCDALTSHVDIVPTVMGLAGLTPKDIAKLSKSLSQSRPVPPLPGADLAPLIRGEWDPHVVIEQDGTERKGVLFITDDEITNTLAFQREEADVRSLEEFQVYKATVDVILNGTHEQAGGDDAPGPGAAAQSCALRADDGLQAGALLRSLGHRARRVGDVRHDERRQRGDEPGGCPRQAADGAHQPAAALDRYRSAADHRERSGAAAAGAGEGGFSP